MRDEIYSNSKVLGLQNMSSLRKYMHDYYSHTTYKTYKTTYICRSIQNHVCVNVCVGLEKLCKYIKCGLGPDSRSKHTTIFILSFLYNKVTMYFRKKYIVKIRLTRKLQ